MSKRLLCLFLLILSVYSAFAQIAVVDSQTALQLVQKLAGTGVTVSNAVLICPGAANGIFVTTASNLNLGEGILLTSGSAMSSVGPASIFATASHNAPGDTSLDKLVTGGTHDACVLEFDFLPIGDTVKFRYVFGSEEYAGFSCTGYNDVFGFFISGPGFTNPTNIALIPGTTIPVAINSTTGLATQSNIATCQAMGSGSPFAQYYVNNSSGTTVSYNGFTTVFTAMATVIPCSTYHLKLAIADLIDWSYDSGVFLEAGSFSSNIISISNAANNIQAPLPYCVRGCKNGLFTFKRQKVTNLPLTIKYQIGGTAVNGTDYTTLPDSVIIPANDSMATRTIVPLTTASGTKTVKLYVFSPFSCSQSQTVFDSSEITIYDSIYAQISTPDTSICPGASVQIKTVGDAILQYRWSPATGLNDTTLKNPTSTPVSNITYTLKATLLSSTCPTVYDNITISLSSAPQVTTEPTNKTICSGTSGSFSLAATGQGLTYQWQVSSGASFSNITNNTVYSGATSNMLTLSNTPLSMQGYQYRCIVFGTCLPRDTSATATLTVTTAPSVTGAPVNKTVCDGDSTSLTVTATGADLTYQWQVNAGSGYAALSASSIYSGVTSNKLSVTGSLYSMNGYLYRCIVSGSCSPSATSSAALLTVNKPPDITQGPATTSVCPDSPASFSVTAVATNINYQWQVKTGSNFSNISNNSTYSGATAATLNITAAPSSMHGYQYRCIVGGICNPQDTSTAATLQIHTVPSVTTDPRDTTVCVGNNAAFAISATGTSILYRWQLDNGTGFSDLADNSTYSGTATNKLQVTNATAGMSGYQYRCYVGGTCLPVDTSEKRTLVVNTLPAVGTHPKDSTICENDAASFSIIASGTAITYQWQVSQGAGFSNVANNTLYSGATTNTLTVSGAPASMNNYQYRCVVSGICTPSATTTAARLVVNTRPAIIIQPKDSTVCDGSSGGFAVFATGTGLTYQWQVNTGSGFLNVANGSTYSGATTNSLQISQAPVAMHGYQYRCAINGTCSPSVITSPALLSVNTLPDITAHPAYRVLCGGDSTTLSVAATGTALSYQWQENDGTGYNNLSDNSVYNGTATNTLHINGAGPGLSGYFYRCIVSGACTPPDTSNYAQLTVYTRPAVIQQPLDSTVCDGNNASFAILAMGTNATYQWQVNDGAGYANISNNSTYTGTATNTLSVSAASLAMNNYQYRCLVSGICDPVAASQPATLRVDTLPDIVAQPLDTIICDGDNTAFSVTAIGSGLTYQWQVNTGSGYVNVSNSGLYSGAATQSLTLTSADVSMDSNVYRCLIAGNCLPPDTSQPAVLTVRHLPAISTGPKDSTVCEGQDVMFHLAATGTFITYRWQVNRGSGYTNLVNDSVYSGVTNDSLLVDSATAGMSNDLYRCIVTGACNPPDTSTAGKLTVNILPDISLQPLDTFVCDGNNAAFAINAVATSISYQWQVDNGTGFSNIANSATYSGAQTANLGIAAASASMDSFRYRCIVSGTCTPPDTSSLAVLRVGTPPAILSAPTATQICEGGDALFSINATGTALTYQWQVNTGTGYADIIDGGVYNGAKTSSIMLLGVTSGMSGYLYRCIVSGACPPSVTSGSLTLMLTVFTLPSVTAHPVSSKICAGHNTSFSASGAGTGVNYQWQVDTGTGYKNVVNSMTYAGATAGTLNVIAASKNMSGYKYRCVVKGVCLPDAISQTANLAVDTLPSVMIEPVDTTVCEQTPASFAIKAEGTQRTYQWQVNTGAGFSNLSNSGVYSGVQADTLKLSNTSLSMNGYQYRCLVNGLCNPPDTSLAVILHTDTIPVITQQPVNDTICESDPAQYSVIATGTNIYYQWQVNDGTGFVNIGNNTLYSGATTDTLSLTGANKYMNDYRYRCVVSGQCNPPDTSGEVKLTVFTRPNIVLQPKDSIVCEGNNATFTISGTGTAITHQWQVDNGSGFANVVNNGVYSGATSAVLQVTAASFSLNNYYYRCIISGACTPPDTSLVAKLTVNVLPDISLQPHDSVICGGGNAAFSILASGTSITYQWQVNTGAGFTNVSNSSVYSGATGNTLAITSGSAAMSNFAYRCVVSGICTPPDTSTTARLTVNTLPDVTMQPKDSAICDGGNAAFAISATGTALTYQWQVNQGTGFTNVANNSTYTGAITNTLQVTTAGVSMNNYLYRCVVSGTCLPPDTSVAAKLIVNTPPFTITQPVNTIVCKDDTAKISVICTGTALAYQWQIDTGIGFVSVVNNTSYGGAATATLNIIGADTSMNGDKFRCIVSGICPPEDTSQVVSLAVYTAPSIANQPRDTSICPGEDVQFTLVSNGSVLTYQWQVDTGSGFKNVVNSATYSGAVSSQLKVMNAGPTLNGHKYRCVVSGYCSPADTSNEVNLEIYPKPQAKIMTDGPTTTCYGDTILLTGLPASGVTYQWQFNNVDIPGAVNPTFYATDSGLYKLTVFNDFCLSIPDQLLLTINPVPDPAVDIPANAIICEDSTVLLLVKHPHESYSYQWTKGQQAMPGAINNYYHVSMPGEYRVRVTNAYGCSATSKAADITSDDSPPPYITTDNILLCTQLFSNYQWYIEHDPIPAAIQDCYLAKQNGIYRVKVTNSKGCVRMSKGYVIDKTAVIWPNPTSGVVNILTGEPARLRLDDMNGKTILTTGFNVSQIDISSVADGVYMLTLYDKSNNVITSERIVKLGR